MTLPELNAMPRYRAEEEFLKCCGSKAWARGMARRRPFSSLNRLLKAAGEIWWLLDPADWMEAFRAHPPIGERKAVMQTAHPAWSSEELPAMNHAPVAAASALPEQELRVAAQEQERITQLRLGKLVAP